MLLSLILNPDTSLWKAARDRGFLITTGPKATRALGVPDPAAECGWHWQSFAAYAAGLTAAGFTLMDSPRQGGHPDEPRQVYVHLHFWWQYDESRAKWPGFHP